MKYKEVWDMGIEVFKIFADKSVIVGGLLLSCFFYIIGGKDDLVLCLLGVMGIDYITGVIKSMVQDTTNSKKGWKGFLKKIAMICIVALAVLLDIVLDTKASKYNCRYFVICFYFANEGLSILENVINAGLPVPKQLKNMLEQCREKQNAKKSE